MASTTSYASYEVRAKDGEVPHCDQGTSGLSLVEWQELAGTCKTLAPIASWWLRKPVNDGVVDLYSTTVPVYLPQFIPYTTHSTVYTAFWSQLLGC